MQTSPNPGEIYFPDEEHTYLEERIDDPKLRMLGWVNIQNEALNLDEYDPWAGMINSPSSRPC